MTELVSVCENHLKYFEIAKFIQLVETALESCIDIYGLGSKVGLPHART
jgi:hypothetical protein